MTKQLAILFCIFCMLAIFSCRKDERDPCLQPRTTVMRAHAYRHADTGKALIDTLLPNPILIPLTDNATVYYGGVKRISQLTFSLSNVADSSRWIIRPDSSIALDDTLTVYYDSQLRFLSNACGYTRFYNLKRVTTTTHALDSAIIARGDVTNDANVEHLKLFY